MGFYESEKLKIRAEIFLKEAKRLFDEGHYDISAFNAEQFCQLILKYYLHLLKGEFPKTHSIKVLLDELGKVAFENEVKNFKLKNIDVIGNIEKAYISSRYLPFDYSKEEVESMLKFCTRIKNFLRRYDRILKGREVKRGGKKKKDAKS